MKYTVELSEYVEDFLDYVHTIFTPKMTVLELDGLTIWDRNTELKYYIDLVLHDSKYSYYIEFNNQTYYGDDMLVENIQKNSELLQLKEYLYSLRNNTKADDTMDRINVKEDYNE